MSNIESRNNKTLVSFVKFWESKITLECEVISFEVSTMVYLLRRILYILEFLGFTACKYLTSYYAAFSIALMHSSTLALFDIAPIRAS